MPPLSAPQGLHLDVDLANRRPLRDEAYLALRRAILCGDLAPGDHLVEREIASRLGLSRSPVREAFRRLEQEGLVRVTRQGVLVQSLDLAAVQELFEIRQQLESLIARLAARRFDVTRLPLLEEPLQDMAAAIAAGDRTRLESAGLAFHQALAHVAGNRRLAALNAAINQEIARFRSLSLAFPARTQSVFDEHRQIAAAVADRDEEAAARLMSEHIGRAWLHARQHARIPAPA